MKALAAALCLSACALAQQPSKLVYAKDGSGVFGYKHTPVQPWSGFHVHDPDRPRPPRVAARAVSIPPPSDAVVLFDGRGMDAWRPSTWRVTEGLLEAGEGKIVSQAKWGDCQIHLEFRTPPPEGPLMNRGNNGVLLMGQFEIQIFDASTPIYADGQLGAVYGQTPPAVDASLPAGEWQSFDIVFTAPRFEGTKQTSAARVTLLHNGVLVHKDQEIYGGVAHSKLPLAYQPGVAEGPLALGGHHSPVQFRNVWVRPLGNR